jgi:surface polysaccharide O-acyltransferase-like enzyme
MLLHLPVLDAGGSGINFSPWLQFDVLHALAASACWLTLVQWGSGVEQRPRLLAGTIVAVLISSTLCDRLHVADALNPWLRGWVAHGIYSRFPLLPWSAFMFFGAWLAALRKELGLGESAPWTAGFACVVAGTAALALWHSPAGRNLTHDGRANPLFAISRASAIALLLYLFLAWQDKAPNALFRKLAWLGRCSLGLYATHLSLFFSVGMPGGSWAARVASRLSFFEVIGLAAVLLALSVALYRTCVCGVNWVRQKIHLAKIELGLL